MGGDWQCYSSFIYIILYYNNNLLNFLTFFNLVNTELQCSAVQCTAVHCTALHCRGRKYLFFPSACNTIWRHSDPLPHRSHRVEETLNVGPPCYLNVPEPLPHILQAPVCPGEYSNNGFTSCSLVLTSSQKCHTCTLPYFIYLSTPMLIHFVPAFCILLFFLERNGNLINY